jgi:cytochrome c2
LVTLGTDFMKSHWPLNPRQGRHDGFEPPVFAWVPSIAVSALTRVEGGRLFPHWRDDLLVGALADRSIWRVRLDQQRVVFTERIPIGERVRDVIQDRHGRLILWTEQLNDAPTQASIIVLEPAAAEGGADGNAAAVAGLSKAQVGELVFARCAGCHRVENGSTHGIGPDLKGLFDRSIAGARGYKYSKALQDLGGKWTDKKLDAFLASPQEFTPGTTMQTEGIANSVERASLIEYLKSRS